MRRLKEDVLHDLPPKIIQDYYCELSPLQLRLYDAFSKSQVKKETEGIVQYSGIFQSASHFLRLTSSWVDDTNAAPAAMHVFQSLQYLRKLCTHPALVLDKKHPDYATVTQELKAKNSDIHDIEYSPKLSALK
jgi:TATA-binding protein-associated factor